MNSPMPQVLMSDDPAMDTAAAVGEHQSDVEHALQMLTDLVEAKGHSMPAMLTALGFMAAAAAVLLAGVKATSMQAAKQEA